MNHRHTKSLGQHFLNDKKMIAKLLSSFELLEGDNVLEIGPGEGALTHEILKLDCHLTALELDTYFANKWQDIARDNDAFTCIEGNALKLDWAAYFPVDKLIGSIPYNISRPLMYKAFKNRRGIKKLIFMVQREFANKLVAHPGNEAYGILAVLSQTFAKVEFLFTIPPSAFYPPPKVTSACVRLTFSDSDVEDEFFIKVVQTAFNQRRKTIKNSLKNYYTPELEDKFDWTKRADQIKPEEYVEFVKSLTHLTN
jgi:16S rRNA (adenine1518-N6/adenine1519-N6)-dimethyltransferase